MGAAHFIRKLFPPESEADFTIRNPAREELAGDDRPAHVAEPHVLAKGVFAALAFAVITGFVAAPRGAGAVVAWIGYVMVSTVLVPRPYSKGRGLVGALDNRNRTLLFVILGPGRAIGTGIVRLLRYFTALSRHPRSTQ